MGVLMSKFTDPSPMMKVNMQVRGREQVYSIPTLLRLSHHVCHYLFQLITLLAIFVG
jgi:hypothetical protein